MSAELPIDRAEVLAAIQAASLAGDSRLAREIIDRYGLDVCVYCAAPTTGRAWYLCMECTDKQHNRVTGHMLKRNKL